MIQRIQYHLWNTVERCDGMSVHGFQWHWVTGVYWWHDRTQKQPDEFWSVQGYTLCPDSVKCSKVDWTALHSTNERWPKRSKVNRVKSRQQYDTSSLDTFKISLSYESLLKSWAQLPSSLFSHHLLHSNEKLFYYMRRKWRMWQTGIGCWMQLQL